MKTIWKFELTPYWVNYEMPYGAEILCAKAQEDKVCVWAKVETDEPRRETRKIVVIGTGHEIPYKNTQYLGTAMLNYGSLVFHVFEVLKKDFQ